MATYSVGGFSLTRCLLRPLAVWAFIRLFKLLDRHPRLMRVVAAFLRLRPLWRVGRTVLVTGDRQVRDVLKRDDDFPLPEKRAAKFLTGPFVLGMTPNASIPDRTRRARAGRREGRCSTHPRAVQGPRPAGNRHRAGRPSRRRVGPLHSCRKCFDSRVLRRRATRPDFVKYLRLLGALIASPESEREKFRRKAEVAAPPRLRAHRGGNRFDRAGGGETRRDAAPRHGPATAGLPIFGWEERVRS